MCVNDSTSYARSPVCCLSAQSMNAWASGLFVYPREDASQRRSAVATCSVHTREQHLVRTEQGTRYIYQGRGGRDQSGTRLGGIDLCGEAAKELNHWLWASRVRSGIQTRESFVPHRRFGLRLRDIKDPGKPGQGACR